MADGDLRRFLAYKKSSNCTAVEIGYSAPFSETQTSTAEPGASATSVPHTKPAAADEAAGRRQSSQHAPSLPPSVSCSGTVGAQSSGKTRKPPKVLQISPPTLLVTTSDFSPMNLCSPSLPTASLTPALLQVRAFFLVCFF